MTTDFYFKISAITMVQQFYVSYLAIGLTPSNTCSPTICRTGEDTINGNECVKDGQCVNKANSYLIYYKDGGKGCKRCPSEFGYVVN